MRILLHYVAMRKRRVAAATGAALLHQLCVLVDPLVLQYLIDRYSRSGQAVTWQSALTPQFVIAMIILVAAITTGWIAKTIQVASVNSLCHIVGDAMFSDGIRNSIRLPFASFENRRTGEVFDGLRRLRSNVELLLKNLISHVCTSFLALAFIVIYTWRIQHVLAFYFLILAPLLAFASIEMSRRVFRLEKEVVRRHAALAGAATEALRNIELIKSMGVAEQEVGRLDRKSKLVLDLELERVRRMRFFTFFHGACVHLLRGGMILLALYLRLEGLMTTGQVLSVYICSMSLFWLVQESGSLAGLYRETEASLNDFSDLLAEASKAPQTGGAAIESIVSLAFQDVGFQYGGQTRPALHGVSFAAEPGEVVAFVGASGSGKTTLVKLISALYPPASGRILFNGKPAETLDADALRARMGLVSQDTQLFSGTIRENLLLVKSDATDQELLAKLEQACATGMLQRASQGLDTVIGESGLRISGGERQRLAIARALLRNPDLIILDEPTSSLDAVTEREIAAEIFRVARSRKILTILITHRLAPAAEADRIYVLDQGRIVESGRHRALLEADGFYARLWRTQMNAAAAFV